MGDKAFMHSFYYAVIVFKAYVYLFNLSCERLYNATIVFNIFFLHAKKMWVHGHPTDPPWFGIRTIKVFIVLSKENYFKFHIFPLKWYFQQEENCYFDNVEKWVILNHEW